MVLRTTGWMGLFIFLFTVLATGTPVESQPPKTPASSKKWAVIKGFRSALFGMDERMVRNAIAKDFKIPKSKVERKVHSLEKTTTLKVKVPNLMAAGGTAEIGYILGYQSKKLVQINVVWGKGVTNNPDSQGVVDAANILRSHFIKKRYQENGYVVNGKMNDTQVIVFRGRDKKNRMILLILTTPKPKKGEKPDEITSLKLSYMLNPDSPDILSIRDDEF